ncbi:MAG: Crp/Fnr family transcriptional regulator [Rhodobacteraceae bacterium]|nr:MAG: Crp/Fnr family transcriptional regulator [Paracoccaceae bacterium]
MQTPLARKLAHYVALDTAELAALEMLQRPDRVLGPGTELGWEGQIGQKAFILASGWVVSYKTLRDGSRQIVDFQVPGDFIGVRNILFRTAEHSFETITDVALSEVSGADLIAVFSTAPRLATAILWALSCEEAMVVEHLVDVGRRSALVRTAHFLLELGARLRLVGLASPDGYDCPLTQYLLADALGLSAIHVNRVLRRLREMGLLTFRDGVVRFDDLDALVKLAEFDMAYLMDAGPLLQRIPPTAAP